MSRWRRVVRRELNRYREETGWDVVELQELYDQALPVLREEFPENSHRHAKLRQTLQQLGDRDELEFLDGEGTYRILDLGERAPGGTTERDSTGSGDADSSARDWSYELSEYQTIVGARSMPAGFRDAALARYDAQCPISGVDRPSLLDVAHVLPWSEYESARGDLQNVLALDKTHHAAFDAGYYTLDGDYRLHVAPDFETDSRLLERTLVERDGATIDLNTDAIDPDYLRRRNETLAWW